MLGLGLSRPHPCPDLVPSDDAAAVVSRVRGPPSSHRAPPPEMSQLEGHLEHLHKRDQRKGQPLPQAPPDLPPLRPAHPCLLLPVAVKGGGGAWGGVGTT